jgi:hypothetical protein
MEKINIKTTVKSILKNIFRKIWILKNIFRKLRGKKWNFKGAGRNMGEEEKNSLYGWCKTPAQCYVPSV